MCRSCLTPGARSKPISRLMPACWTQSTKPPNAAVSPAPPSSPAPRGRRSRVKGERLAPLRLDRIPDQCRNIGAAEIFYRADAGGGGDVDFRQEAVDHVNADEEQPALAQCRSSGAGTRLTAPANSPSTKMMRLSPSRTAGRNFCTTHGSRNMEANRSYSEPKLRSSRAKRNTASPPLP